MKELPKGIRENKEAVAETIENNVRRLIIDEQPINPKYYERMSQLLDALIEKRRQEAIDYQKYLAEIVELARQVKNGVAYPKALDTLARRALYDNLEKNEALALVVDLAVRNSRQDDWRGNPIKVKKVKFAIKDALLNTLTGRGRTTEGAELTKAAEGSIGYGKYTEDEIGSLTETLLELVKNQREY